MASLVHFILLATTIYITSSEDITCDPSISPSNECTWNCSVGAGCNNNIYHCPSTASYCALKCYSCTNLKIYSSSNLFNIHCTNPHGCSNIEIIAETHTNVVDLGCKSSTYCNNITFNCPAGPNGSSNCQCLEGQQSRNCDNRIHFASSAPSKNPTEIPTTNPTNILTKNPTYYKAPTYNPTTTPTQHPNYDATKTLSTATNNPTKPPGLERIVIESTMNDIDETHSLIIENDTGAAMFHLVFIGVAVFFTGCIAMAIILRMYTKITRCKSAANVNKSKLDTNINDSSMTTQKRNERISIEKVQVEGAETRVELQNGTDNDKEQICELKDNIRANNEGSQGIHISPLSDNDDIDEMYNQNETLAAGNITADEDASRCVDDIDISISKPLPLSPLPGETSVSKNDKLALEKIWNPHKFNRPSLTDVDE